MIYDRDYFERGLQTGKSMYENYRWMPEMTIPLAHEIINYLEIERKHTILDFGCAKGYLVKAFRLLHYNAWGTDISEYALDNVPTDVKDYVFNWIKADWSTSVPSRYDWIIIKDVLEHIKHKNLIQLLPKFTTMTKNIFVIVPLGKDGRYYAGTNNLDPSHVICEDFQWWCDLFNDVGFKVVSVDNKIPYIKEAYKEIPNAHGFFKLKANFLN